MKIFKTNKCVISIMCLLVLALSSVAYATVTSDVSQEYMLLAWSPDETRILAVLHKHEPEIINEKIQLVEYELTTGNTEVLAGYEDVTENINMAEVVQSPVFAAKIAEYMQNGFIQGEKLCEPFVPSGQQILKIRNNDQGYRIILQQSLDGIRPAEVVVLELADWVQSLKSRDISELVLQDVFVSPSRQKALVQTKAVYQKETDIELINRGMFEFGLYANASKLENICGYRFYCQGDYARAQECFENAVNLDSANAIARYNLACIFALMNDPDKAITMLAEAIKLDPALKAAALEDVDLVTITERILSL